jgi:hypothetical protein
MSIVRVDANKCDFPDCGHVWLSKSEPERCAKCKKKKWNKLPSRGTITGLIVEDFGKTVVTVAGEDNRVISDGLMGVMTPRADVPKIDDIMQAVKDHPKFGEKCPHDWSNWLQCDICNPRSK